MVLYRDAKMKLSNISEIRSPTSLCMVELMNLSILLLLFYSTLVDRSHLLIFRFLIDVLSSDLYKRPG